MTQSVTVLGAGIVGICCALELQRRGIQVRLLDRRGPGEETSSGNAGILSYSNITPLADPALLPRLHRLFLNMDDDFLLHYPHLLSLLPWLLRFVSRCRRDTFLHDGGAMNQLTSASVELHKQWIAQAGAEDLLNRGGGLKLYRHQQTFLRDQLERELLQQCAVRHTVLDAQQAYELEPDLKRIFVKAVLIDESLSIRNPERLCKSYAQMFTDAGGRAGSGMGDNNRSGCGIGASAGGLYGRLDARTDWPAGLCQPACHRAGLSHCFCTCGGSRAGASHLRR
jgi:D-amino-acid dehydrogenase